MSAQLNSVDWMTASTTSLLHREQELAASKQLLVMGWPTRMSEKDREHETKGMAHYYGVATATLKTKQGASHFTMAEMWGKESRNHFLHIKADAHTLKRSVEPRYLQRGRDQIPASG